MGIKGLLAAMAGFVFAAFPASTNYQLQDYGIGSGGTNSSSSATYKLQATTGEISGTKTTGTLYSINSASIQGEQSNVPPAPTLDNGSGTYYNKLNFIINTGGNPTDATYAVAADTNSGFSSVKYVQADGTLGSSPVFRTYSAWGSGTGTLAVGLNPNTTYYFKVSAFHGTFSQSAFGPNANIATVNPSLTFSVSPNNLSLGLLSAGSIITSSNLTFSFTTNAANGGFVYVAGSDIGLKSPSNSNYIISTAQPSDDLSSANEGFGLQATTSAPLTTQSPYTSTGTVVGAIYTSFQQLFSASGPVSSSPTTTALFKAKASVNTPPGTDYADTLTFVATASY